MQDQVEDNINYLKPFSGAKLRVIDSLNYSALIFSSGKIVLTGINTESKAKNAADDLITRLIKYYPGAAVDDLLVHNYVLALSFGRLDLNKLYANNQKFLTYELELFHGLIYRCNKYKRTATMFVSGKINVTGIKHFDLIPSIMRHLEFLINPHLKCV